MKQPAETTNFLVLDKPACAGRLEQYTSTLWRSIHGHAELVSASVFLFFLFFLIPTKAYASTEYVTVYAGLPAKIINKVVDKVEASESTNAKEYITVYAGNYEIQKIGDEVTEKVYTNNPSGGSIVKTRPITSLRSASGGEAIWSYNYYYTDYLGSTRFILTDKDIQQGIQPEDITKYTYYAYGNPIETATSGTPPSTTAGRRSDGSEGSPFVIASLPAQAGEARQSILNAQTLPTEDTYTGQKKDEETGLMYYNARYYDPTLGLFIQADSVDDGLNKYQYVRNNPVNATDPSGHMMDAGTNGGGGSPPPTQPSPQQPLILGMSGGSPSAGVGTGISASGILGDTTMGAGQGSAGAGYMPGGQCDYNDLLGTCSESVLLAGGMATVGVGVGAVYSGAVEATVALAYKAAPVLEAIDIVDVVGSCLGLGDRTSCGMALMSPGAPAGLADEVSAFLGRKINIRSLVNKSLDSYPLVFERGQFQGGMIIDASTEEWVPDMIDTLREIIGRKIARGEDPVDVVGEIFGAKPRVLSDRSSSSVRNFVSSTEAYFESGVMPNCFQQANACKHVLDEFGVTSEVLAWRFTSGSIMSRLIPHSYLLIRDGSDRVISYQGRVMGIDELTNFIHEIGGRAIGSVE